MKYVSVRKKTVALLMALILALSAVTVTLPVLAAESTVNVASGGSFADALSKAADGGVIQLNGTCTLPSGFSWTARGRHITVRGGTLDASAVSSLSLGDHVTFESMTLKLKSGGSVYAKGYSLKIDSTVTVSGTATVYGGASGGTVASTDLTILSGTYNKIYGGGNGGAVTGDTHLTVGGTVNATITETNHSGTNNIYGGGYGDKIGGNTNLTVTDNAKAHYVYGGSAGTGATIGGTANTLISGGRMMSFYGGNVGVDAGCDVHALMVGGWMEQFFGGSSGANLSGNVVIRLMGGTVVRRVYGGCYNEVTSSGISANWQSSYGVTGNLTTVLGNGVDIQKNYSDGDTTIFAKSRHKSKVDGGKAIFVFAGSDAYNKYSGKLGASDLKMIYALLGTSNSDEKHTHSYVLNGATLTETCGSCSHSATATLTLDPSVSTVYTGEAICPVTVTYSTNWYAEVPTAVTYSNNVNAGTATASLSHAQSKTALSMSFTVERANPSAPALTAVAESVQTQKDGRIVGLTTAMELCEAEGEGYRAVTDPNMTFAPGDYLVRIAETANNYASAPTRVTVGAGRHVIDLDALSIRCQLPEGDTVSSPHTALRLISTVDSLYYEQVGFRVWIENGAGEMVEQELLVSTRVFTSLRGKNGETVTDYTPSEEFADSSAYFFTRTLENIGAEYYGRLIRVQAFVVTSDGYTVAGEICEGRLSNLLGAPAEVAE